MAHLWSGRFDGRPGRAICFAFGASFRFDRRLFEDDVRGSLAWAAALARAGVLSKEDANAIHGGLRQILDAGLADPAFVTDAACAMKTSTPSSSASSSRAWARPAGGCTPAVRGTSRSRVDLRLYLKRRVPPSQHAIAALVSALADLAEPSGRRDHAVVHAPAAGAASPRRALPAVARRRAPARSSIDSSSVLDGARRAAARLGRDCRHRYPIDVRRLADALGFSRDRRATAST